MNNDQIEIKQVAQSVLKWFVNGCLNYRASLNEIGSFITVCCDQADGTTHAPFNEVYAAYLRWRSKTLSGAPLRKRTFSLLMSRRFKIEKAGGSVRFKGVKLNPLYSL